MEWTYHDTTNYIYPVEAGRLSSGSVVIVGSGYEYNEELGFWGEVLVMIKTDADACDVPGCRLTSSTDDVNNLEKRITISPNPASNFITINTSENKLSYSLEIYTIDGKMQYRNVFVENQSIDISNYNPGLYFVKLTGNEGEAIVKKIIKQ
jgi:hypothetical protein